MNSFLRNVGFCLPVIFIAATTGGTSAAIYAGAGSSSRALEKGLKKGLQEIEKDAGKIKEAMEG